VQIIHLIAICKRRRMAAELEGLIAGGTTRGIHIPLYALPLHHPIDV